MRAVGASQGWGPKKKGGHTPKHKVKNPLIAVDGTKRGGATVCARLVCVRMGGGMWVRGAGWVKEPAFLSCAMPSMGQTK